MINIIYGEYNSLLQRLQSIQSKMDDLPQGYISKKTIKGKQYFYIQNRVNGKVKSRYIKEDEVQRISIDLELSRKYKEEIPKMEYRLQELEQAAKLVDKKMSRELRLLKLSVNMDSLSITQKDNSISFANAMNAIEGVGISESTESKIEEWKNGDKPFLNVFSETLANIKDKEVLEKAEADITNLAMLAIYNHKYKKFDSATLLDIHFSIFGQIYGWAGEMRTIQIVKYEEVLGGDSVRYGHPKEIKKQLEVTMKEISKLKSSEENKKDIVFRLVRIIANIWQIHPFREGNTRTVIVFAVLLGNSLGLEVKHELFKVHSAYVRNALVWASQGMYSKYEYLEKIFFDAMLEENEYENISGSQNGEYEMIGDYKVADYKEQPHIYVEN